MAQKNSKSNKKKSKNPWPKRISIIAGSLVVLTAALILWFWTYTNIKWDGDEPRRIYIPGGSDAQAITDTLANNLGAKYASHVSTLWGWQGGNTSVAEGSYVVQPGTSALSLSRKILYGQQDPVKASFGNARTMQQMADKLTKRLEINAEDFLAACDTILPGHGFESADFPAAFLPDTYEFYWNAKPATVVNRLLGVHDRFWNDERRQKALALGLSPEQVATVASIVEEETAKSDEKPKVARLYLNRLKKNMLLQADPTVKFAVGDFGLRRILNKHLQVESPYNTYKHPGLPPGPIRIVEGSTLDAVLNAPQHDYLYMCAKEDFSGYHNFAADYQTHLQNARRYQAELNRRGIK